MMNDCGSYANVFVFVTKKTTQSSIAEMFDSADFSMNVSWYVVEVLTSKSSGKNVLTHHAFMLMDEEL